MNEKMKAALEKGKGFFEKLGKKTVTTLAVCLGAIVIIAVVATVVLNNRPYAVLFTGLSSQEVSSVISYLQDNGITDYRMENNDTILVPRGQEVRLQGQLSMDGYPKSGFFYEKYFENIGALSTESERNVAFLIALQEKMQAVIRSMEGIKEASVLITQGEDRRYILDDSNMVEASASVSVTTSTGQKLSSQQVTAIQNLVARGVQGLQIENISIIDSMGNFYSAGDDESYASADASALKLRLEEQESNKVRSYIMQVLSPLYGEENVRVSVNCTVDVSRSTIESVKYDETTWAADGSTGGRGIIGSRIYDHEVVRDGDDPVGGVPGTTTNSDLSTYVEDLPVDGSEQQIKVSGQDDYLVDTTKTNTSQPAGILTDLMVAVSINSTEAGAVNTTTLMPHVARAAGIVDADMEGRINILSMPFYQAPEVPVIPGTPIPNWAVYAAAGGLLLFVLVLLLVLVLRRRGKKRRRAEEAAAVTYAGFVPDEIPQPTGANVMNVQTEKSMELRKDIRQFADENPEIAAQMVKAWLKGGEESG